MSGLTVDAIELNEAETMLLGDIAGGKVIYTRGVYWHVPRQRSITGEVQRLRALGLARLADVPASRRLPPTRNCELTGKGDEVWQARRGSWA